MSTTSSKRTPEVQPIVKVLIVYTMSVIFLVVYIYNDDVVYFLDRTLQGVQCLRLSDMQFYNTICDVTQYNNTIAFSVTSGDTTTPHNLTLAPSNYVIIGFTVVLHTMNGASSGFTVTYSNISGKVTITKSNSFLLNLEHLNSLLI